MAESYSSVSPRSFSLHNVCFLLNYSSPAACMALHAAFYKGGGEGIAFINLYLDSRGRKKSSWKKGAFIIFEPITIMVSANPTIVQVFQNRDISAPLQPKGNHLVHLLETQQLFFFLFYNQPPHSVKSLQLSFFFNKIISRYSTMLTPLNT